MILDMHALPFLMHFLGTNLHFVSTKGMPEAPALPALPELGDSLVIRSGQTTGCLPKWLNLLYVY